MPFPRSGPCRMGRMSDDGSHPEDLVPLRDDEKDLILPELARRAATLYALAAAGMIRAPRNAAEQG